MPCNLSHRAQAAKFHKNLSSTRLWNFTQILQDSPINFTRLSAKFAEFYEAIFYQNSIKFRRATLKAHGKSIKPALLMRQNSAKFRRTPALKLHKISSLVLGKIPPTYSAVLFKFALSSGKILSISPLCPRRYSAKSYLMGSLGSKRLKLCVSCKTASKS